MKRVRLFVVVAAAIVAVVVGVVIGGPACVSSPFTGGSCKHSTDCSNVDAEEEQPAEECVFVDDEGKKGGVCLPIVKHEQTTCVSVDECDAALFPIEATCKSGQCQCATIEGCSVVDHVHCRCVSAELSGEGDFCNGDDDCVDGLNCKADKCALGDEPGDRCGSGNICVGVELECKCSDRVGNCGGAPNGTCLVREGGSCDADSDCVGEAPLCDSSGRCSFE